MSFLISEVREFLSRSVSACRSIQMRVTGQEVSSMDRIRGGSRLVKPAIAQADIRVLERDLLRLGVSTSYIVKLSSLLRGMLRSSNEQLSEEDQRVLAKLRRHLNKSSLTSSRKHHIEDFIEEAIAESEVAA